MQMPSAEQLEARIKLAQRFLDEIILPAIVNSSLTLETAGQRIPELFETFRNENLGPGDDFELAHSWQIAWARDLHNASLAESQELPDDATDIANATEFLRVVAFPPEQ